MKTLQEKEIKAFLRFKVPPYGSRVGSREDKGYETSSKELKNSV